MAVGLEESGGSIVDRFDGRRDLEAGMVRVLHTGSFSDDPTRILRGVDLAVRLGFEIEAETSARAREATAQGALDTLSPARLRQAWRRMLATRPTAKLELAERLGLLRALHPEIELGSRAPSRFDLATDDDPLVHLRVLAGNRSSVARAVAERFGLADREIERWASLGERLAALSAAADALLVGHASGVRAAVEPFDEEELALVERSLGGGVAAVVDRYRREVEPVGLVVRGDDLVAAGQPEGPAIGRALERTLRARTDGEIEAEEEFEYACRQLESEE